jgi:hypothetical protein
MAVEWAIAGQLETFLSHRFVATAGGLDRFRELTVPNISTKQVISDVG